MAEVRLGSGSYREEGRRRGLAISREGRESGKKQERREEREASGLPPGFQ
jgi:hypothetical protein